MYSGVFKICENKIWLQGMEDRRANGSTLFGGSHPMHKVRQHHSKVGGGKLKIYIINSRATTKNKNTNNPIVEIKTK